MEKTYLAVIQYYLIPSKRETIHRVGCSCRKLRESCRAASGLHGWMQPGAPSNMVMHGRHVASLAGESLDVDRVGEVS